MAGHVSSARAVDKMSNSNSILQVIKETNALEILSDNWKSEKTYMNSILRVKGCILVIMDWNSPFFIVKSSITGIFFDKGKPISTKN